VPVPMYTSPIESLRDLYVEELRDLYNGEKQLYAALRKMAKAAASMELRSVFDSHLEATRQHARRIESIFQEMGDSLWEKPSPAMIALIDECREITETRLDPLLKDSALVVAAQRVEHYEIAGYSCAYGFAKILDAHPAASLLSTTLTEEIEAAKMLSIIAAKLGLRANQRANARGRSAMPAAS
jgi:ferritin-like metal-binding protein YciE